MKSTEFGAYLKVQRERKGIPQRIVAHALNIDTSTLSKIELGERQIVFSMLKPLADILKIEYKNVEITYITHKILADFTDSIHLLEAIQQLNHQLASK
jgi:transcriptional regulator with XRE-family HTH domain